MELTKKTSLFSDSRFPMFVRGSQEFDSLRRFVRSYFESLEVEGGPNQQLNMAREYSDVDSTTSEFLERFYSILCPSLPTKIATDKRLLLKHARELYQKKGTPDSFHLLFKIIFNEVISLKYPHEFILKTSDGRWNQPVAIHAIFGNTSEAALFATVNQEIVSIKKTGIVRNTVLAIKKIGPEMYEIKLDRQKSMSFFIGDPLTIGSLTGTVIPSVVSVSIIKPGKKFKLGQPLKLDLGNAKGTIVKVAGIDSAGGIKKLKIIRYGINYNNDMTMTVAPITSNNGFISVFADIAAPINEASEGFNEFGSILKMGKLGPMYDYFLEDYMEATEYYTAAVVGTFGGDTEKTPMGYTSTIDDYAVISLKIGPVINYPGYWSDNKGRLSDPLICLQDNAFYQNFSYVIQSSVPRDHYETFVKNVVHPAGMRMFSDLLIDNSIEVGTSISSQDGVDYFVDVSDLVDLPDSASYFMHKKLSDSAPITEFVKLDITKPLVDSFGVTDAVSKDITLPKTDSVTVPDVFARIQTYKLNDILVMSDSDSEYVVPTFSLSDAYGYYSGIDSSATTSIAVLKSTSDATTTSDSVVKSDIIGVSDTITSTDTQTKTSTINKVDSVSMIDSVVKSETLAYSDSIVSIDSMGTSSFISTSDSVTTSDTQTKSVVKTTTDITTMSESIAKSDSIIKADTSSVSDISVLNTTKSISDSVIATEIGTYADINYIDGSYSNINDFIIKLN
jgi:hypothetical protein